MTSRVCLRNNTPHPDSVYALQTGFRSLPGWAGKLAACLLLLAIGGCKAVLDPIAFKTDPVFSNLTGNWVFQFTPTSGPTEFTQLSGFVDDVGGSQDWATAALQGTLTDCFAGQTFTPWYGNINGTAMNLYSFLITGEMITITGNSDATFTQFTGTYTLGGPCANGETGTVTGTHYADLIGTYSGSVGSNPAQTLQLNLTQNKTATGDGTFFVTGSAKLQGFSCFTSGNIAPYAGTVVGNTVQLQFVTNESPASTLTVSGTFDPKAQTITVNSIQVSGGACAGSLGGASLTLQSH